MYEINVIYDNLNKANIIGLKAALASIESVRSITIDKSQSTITLLSKRKKIREDLLINAGKLNNCSFRTIINTRKA